MPNTGDYEYWKERVPNPEALGESEKNLWKKLEPILVELLDELKANGKIETNFTLIETQHLGSLMENLNHISMNHNTLIHIPDTLEKAKKFDKATSEFGFKEDTSTHLVMEVTVLVTIMNTECFKNLILFHLKDVNYQANNFRNTMKKYAPNAWTKLEPFVYSKFRNSLAHGVWAIENKEIVLFENAELIPYEKLTLADFMIKTKEQNLLYACLFYVITEKIKAMFFSFL